MKKKSGPRVLCLLLPMLLWGALSPAELGAYRYRYAEQYYKMYRRNLYHYPEDIMTNINYLLAARSSPFANPLNALAEIETPEEWKYYQKLFLMHVNLLLLKEHMNLADRFDKYNAYFYNAPYRKTNLESLQSAEKFYRQALTYWPEAVRWAEEASAKTYRWYELEEVAAWRDEAWQIVHRELDYQEIIERDLDRLLQIRERFAAMDNGTY